MTKKLNKNGGFTMVELLIVIAIIAILIAVSIPMFSNAMEGVREGIDEANYRDALSLGNVEYLTHPEDFEPGNHAKVYAYKVNEKDHRGELVYVARDDSEKLNDNNAAVVAECTCNTGGRTYLAESRLNAKLYVVIIPAVNGSTANTHADVVPVWLPGSTYPPNIVDEARNLLTTWNNS